MNDILRFVPSIVPLQSVLAVMSIGLSACGPAPDGLFLGDAPTLSGTLTDWTRGPGYTLQAILFRPSDGADIIVSNTPIDPSGRFSFKLPSYEEAAPFLSIKYARAADQDCSLRPTFAPEDLRMAGVALRISDPTRDRLKSLQLALADYPDIGHAPEKFTTGEFIFSESDGQIAGQAVCKKGTLATSYDVRLMRGWNLIFSHWSQGPAGTQGTTVVRRSEPQPEDCKWYAQ